MSGSDEAVSSRALQAVTAREQLILEAMTAAAWPEFCFRVVNHTIRFCPYDRAVLFAWQAGRPRVAAISGAESVARRAPLVETWERLAGRIDAPAEQHLLQEGSEQPDGWTELASQTGPLSVAWLPLVRDGTLLGLLWLERWQPAAWRAAELSQLEPLLAGYAAAWQRHETVWQRLGRGLNRRKRWLGAAVLVVALLGFLPMRLRVVAPCRVVPDQPRAVSAPMRGVIEELHVRPGQEVSAGALLATYDPQAVREELVVAQQEVAAIESDLRRARVQAFQDEETRTETVLLEKRLAQQYARLELAEHRAGRLAIRASVGGTVVLEDPEHWRSQPVQIGERLLLLVDPERSKVVLQVPQADNVGFEVGQEVTVILRADARSSRLARLEYVAPQGFANPGGEPTFRAEARWVDQQAPPRLGLTGVAVLHGPRVPFWYWLLRKPLAWLRASLGL